MSKKREATAVLEAASIQTAAGLTPESAPTASQEGQQQTVESVTELTPMAMAQAAQSALERTQRRLQELAQAAQEREQRRLEIEQELMDKRQAAQTAEQHIPVALEAVNDAKALRMTLQETPAAARAVSQVEHAEAALAQARHAASVTRASAESALVAATNERAALDRDERLDEAERSELQPLIPHLQMQLAQAHRAAGLELLAQLAEQFHEQQEKATSAHAAADREDAVLEELKKTIGQQLAVYPELALETRRLLPAERRPIVIVMESQIEYMKLLRKYVPLMSADAPLLWNETPLYSFLAFDKEYTKQWLQGRNLENLEMRLREAGRFLDDVKQLIQFKAR